MTDHTATTPDINALFTPAFDVACEAVKAAGYPWTVKQVNALLIGMRAAFAKLAADGRMLPAPTETTTEWGVWWHGDDPDGIVMSEQHMSNRQWAERVGAERIGQYGIKSYTVRCCEHRKFADGSVWISGWVKAEPEAPVDRSSVNLAVAEVKP